LSGCTYFGSGGWVIFNSLHGLKHSDSYLSQNHETQLNERRNKLDLQINSLTEQENTKLLRMLERIAEKVGAKTGEDPSIQVPDQAHSSREARPAN